MLSVWVHEQVCDCVFKWGRSGLSPTPPPQNLKTKKNTMWYTHILVLKGLFSLIFVAWKFLGHPLLEISGHDTGECT